MSSAPDGIDLSRHRDLRGLSRGPLVRRTLLGLLFLVPLLALLVVFGQTPTTSRASGPDAQLVVRAPDHLRGGLLYQVRIEIDAIHRLAHPAVVLSDGWWEELSLNAIVPDPTNQSYAQGGVSLQFGPIAAGGRLRCWISFQVNPTAVGRRTVSVVLQDGSRVLVGIRRPLTLFP